MSKAKSDAITAGADASADDANRSAGMPTVEQLVETELERLGQGGRWVWYV